MNRRPLSVMIVGWLYIVTGAVSLVAHGLEFKPSAFPYDLILAELVSLLALVAGIYILRRQNWARWLALAWIVFHVILSAFHSLQEMAMHAAIAAVLAYFLFRPLASRYFHPVRTA